MSCPTCARTDIDIEKIVQEIETRLQNTKYNLKDNVYKGASMGCVVNGPGEARDADIGIAGGRGEALLFKKGEVIKKIDEKNVVKELMKYIDKDIKNK